MTNFKLSLDRTKKMSANFHQVHLDWFDMTQPTNSISPDVKKSLDNIVKQPTSTEKTLEEKIKLVP